ncbi:acyl-CoA thioesterase [Actinomadura scrupuli]|uniref:acyl-CoA thioesterase n=1 Tax=Actinomadura scrupuli TaxID=559629 RepID=UPI003D953148
MSVFSTPVVVRGYELDVQGHLNNAVYHQYAEHARWECLHAAGAGHDELLAAGIGPVQLEATIKFFRELRAGDEVEVTCEFTWGEGKIFHLGQDFRRADGTLAASLTSVFGMLDRTERRLVADPAGRLRALATDPAVLGL